MPSEVRCWRTFSTAWRTPVSAASWVWRMSVSNVTIHLLAAPPGSVILCTVRVSFIVQQPFQDFPRQAVRLRVTADLVHDLLQRARRAGGQFAKAEEPLRLPSVLRGGRGEGAACVASTSRQMVTVAMIHSPCLNGMDSLERKEKKEAQLVSSLTWLHQGKSSCILFPSPTAFVAITSTAAIRSSACWGWSGRSTQSRHTNLARRRNERDKGSR